MPSFSAVEAASSHTQKVDGDYFFLGRIEDRSDLLMMLRARQVAPFHNGLVLRADARRLLAARRAGLRVHQTPLG